MAVTRINNNQITDASTGNVVLGINAGTKLQNFSVTAGKIANNLTYGSDLTVTGNLTVQGQTTTIDTVSTVIEDPILVLASNQTGSPTVDIGFIGERGTEQNIAFVWDESAGEFVTGFTTDLITNTIVTISSYANFHTNNANVAGNLLINGTTSLVGNITSALNVTGSITGANLLTGGLISSTGNITGGNLSAGSGTIVTSGNIDGANLNATSGVTASTVSATGTVTGGNLATGGTISAASTVTGGNVATGGTVSAAGNITANPSSFFIGNGSQLTGVVASSANAETLTGAFLASNVLASSLTSVGNLTSLSVVGTTQSGNLATGGTVSATATITGGNVATSGTVSATGDITGGNLATGGTVSSTGTVTGGNIATGGTVSATATITGGNIATGGTVSATGTATAGNIATGGTVSATGNVTGGNLITLGTVESNTVSATNTVTGGNIATGGTVSAAGTVTGGNVATGGTVSATATITGGNVATGGTVSATSTITGGNLATGGTVSSTGTVTGGNIATGGTVSAAGNITGGNVITDNIYSTANTTLTINASTISLNPVGNVNLNSRYINNLALPVQAGDAANKQYVDEVAQGLDPKASCLLATAVALPAYTYNNGTAGVGATITLSSTGNLAIDGTVVAAGERILIKNETTTNTPYNGIYVVTTAGTPSVAAVLTRATDFDNGSPSGEIPSAFTFVESGVVNADAGFVCTTNAPVTVGTTPITFTQFSGAGTFTAGNALSLNGTQFNVNVDLSGANTIAINGSNQLFIPAGATLTTPNIGAATGTSVSVTGTVTGGNIATGGTVSATGTATAGNIATGGTVSATATITGGNIATGGTVSATGDITGGNVATSGTVSSTGTVTGGNIATGGTISATSTITSSATITGGNLATGGTVSATGTATAGNIATGGTVSATGTATAGNLATGGTVSATGDITGGNVATGGTVSAAGTVTGGNIATAGTSSAGGNITGGNLLTGGLISATSTITSSATITGGNIATGGTVSAAGNISANPSSFFIGNGSLLTGVTASSANAETLTGVFLAPNVLASSLTSVGNLTVLSVVGTTTTGNLATGGTVSATATITGGNIATGGTVSATGTATAGNIATGGTVSATATITGGNIATGGTVSATGDITGGNIVISGDDITDTNGRVNFNTAGSDVDFAVNGDTVANVLYVDAGTGTVSFGSATQTTNSVVAFNATNSILMPVGSTAQRPAGVTGQFRFNTTINSLELYDNSAWVAVGQPDFTLITDQQFNGDGSTAVFTLSANATTAGSIVSINGVQQIPTIAYAVTGTTLTFTEAPATGDLIDVRVLVTTTQVYSISNSSGTAAIAVQDGSNIVALTGDLVVSGNATVQGNILGTQINNGTTDINIPIINGTVHIDVAGVGNVVEVFSTGTVFKGNVLPFANVTGDLGSSTQRWKDLYLSGSSIVLGNTVIKNTSGNSIGFFGPDGTTPATIAASSVDTTTIANGTSSMAVVASGGNIRANIAGATIINITSAGIQNGQANGVGNIGASGATFNTVFAKATSAQYADLAEKYTADAEYAPGTVVSFGGDAEVTLASADADRKVAGVVSTNPSYIMNSECAGEFVATVALTGRVPCQVTGSVKKGDLMVAAGNGKARAEADPKVGTVIGKALADSEGDATIEVVVGRF